MARPIQITDVVQRPEVRAILLAFDGMPARSARRTELFEQLTQLVGPEDGRAFAVIDLVLAFYTCDLNRDGTFRRNKTVL